MNDNKISLYTTDQSVKKGIVLNRMYTGSYLSSNLGHEVINMFQADDDNYYLYLNAKGNFTAEGNKVGTMLLVRGIGSGSIEVVGMATNLKRVNSANNPLPRDLGVINEEVRTEQNKFLKSITYGTVPILKIFDKGGQQSIYVSYWVKKEDFYTPKEGVRIIIEFPPQKKNNDDNYKEKLEAYIDSKLKEEKNEDGKTTITIRLKDYNFASTSLHQYILGGQEGCQKQEDLSNLSEICEQRDLYWESKNRKINSSENVERREVSLFDICQIQNDENRFSNALSYFMIKYKDLWQKFIKEQFNIEEEIKIVSVTREEDAKVDKDPWKEVTGGRVDLLIRTNNSYIIIENKIDSSIIENEVNGKLITQLERYYNYVEYLKYEEIARIRGEIAKLEKDKETPYTQFNDPKKKHWKKRDEWGETVKKLDSKIEKLKTRSLEIANRKILGCVLSPNYNQPLDRLLVISKRPALNVDWYEINHNIQPFTWLSYDKVYKWLSTNAKTYLEPGEEYDANFKALYDAMKKHTYDYENLALFEEMKNTFFTRIQECSNSKDTNA